MAVNTSRSLNGSMHSGTSDGSYRKQRPDTEVIAGMSNVDMRQFLNPKDYDNITFEIPQGDRVLGDGTVC